MATGTKTKKRQKAQEVDEDLELEELDEDVEEESPKKKRKGGGEDIEFGVADLAAYLNEQTGKDYSTRDLRTLIRKMAREDKARVKREIVPGNRTRYNWEGGLEHPEVKAIIAAVTGGEVEAGRKAALDKLKSDKAKKDAAGGTTKKKRKPAPVAEDEDDLEELEDDDEDE